MPAMSCTIEPGAQLDDLRYGLRDPSLKADYGKTDAGLLFPDLLHIIFSFAFDSLGNGFATLPKARAESSWLSRRYKASCSMVCKHWRDSAVPMLYGHVVLRRDWQLFRFLRTLNSRSNSFAYRRMVKSLVVDLDNGYGSAGSFADHMMGELLLLCPNLAELAYSPSQRTRLSDEAVSLIERLDPSLVTCLALGEKIDATPDLLQFLQELPRLQVLSLHSGRQLFQTLRKHPVSLPHVTTLSLTLDSNVTSGFALSTPSLTSLSISFGPSWTDNPNEVIGEITATVGQSLRYLDIAWEDAYDSKIPGIFDLNVLEPCHALRHLVVCGVSSFVGTHATIRFFDVWRHLMSMSEWREAEQLDPDELIKNQLHVELLRAHLPNIVSIRVFDNSLRRSIPDLPTILSPMGCEHRSLRVHVLGSIIWDTPTMVFDESRLDQRRGGVPLRHSVDEFVSKYKYLGITIPDESDSDSDVEGWEVGDTGSTVFSEYE
ncbi:hypothetical protein OE88DRAFT_1649270 [Heliocybe sulcata]|uniref:F-box domain-containing protein n=1 Tax=Heliocybe sulcata TaxID=5364 RepID=A0A5C3MKT7_9AGAM|nr:hypothetical protein OE88DRAFT_1649270 [Heliocybe sulcata]